ncbi:UDP-N-acetylmuramate dehydrogenase [Paludicola sp. MB14-C6]|uniref:UDP-N-acetylmuramate dehydrogenase n=1 Tax=Paludihabitans sp. MB14-C6 TaxID=3070656 RepID=UPI0027DB7C73|nr:UDP-N-acetylmuramate dehydrogenase [Paludicola sp. MB14-C6]WMJ23323.1 UDP-N-acetylmuramate dehydrogenase [Paludicola sp. MB14-C6]
MSNSIQLTEELKNTTCELQVDIDVAPYTSFRIGGKCKYLVKPKNFTDIKEVVSILKNYNIDYYFLGNGSNVLVSDNGYNGAIILLANNLTNIQVDGYKIDCEAGVALSKLCSVALDNELSGLEFAFGIPGTVGGAVYMNAGAYGGEIKDTILCCTYLDENNEIKTMYRNEMELSYRHSIFSDSKCCILSASFVLQKEDKDIIKNRMTDFMTRRKTKQPLEFPSAGSTFKRPEGNYASALIEQCGLKGYRIGDAMVSDKHSGFVVNVGKATCDDVLKVVDHIKQVVFEQTGYELECEIKTLGF